jgi:hypothetical protein
MQQNGYKPHECHVAIVFDKVASLCQHQIAAEKAKFSLRVFLFQGGHQIGGVQVA